jgi:DNA-binding helix-hairpin-helix protein with protein kinase domain
LNGALTQLTIQEQLGADGAEGRVFRAETPSKSQYAVKIYFDDYRAPRTELLFKKLHLMMLAQHTFAKSEEPRFAWPLATVHLGTSSADLKQEKFVGFAMPLLPKMREFYSLIKRARQHKVPTLTQRIALAFFVAKGFRMLHAGVTVTPPTGGSTRISFAVGDVNDSNIRATEANVICFFDCDSYILHLSKESFGHWTTTEAYSSPEFLASPAREKYTRSAKDDDFGLAVLIFRLLNDWQLPYAYDGAGGSTKTRLILEGRFPYGRTSKDQVLPAAKGALQDYQSATHDRIKELFEQAFAKDRRRPSSADWVGGLQMYLLSRSDLRTRPQPVAPPPPPTAKPLSPPSTGPTVSVASPVGRASPGPRSVNIPPPNIAGPQVIVRQPAGGKHNSNRAWLTFMTIALVLLGLVAIYSLAR